MHKQTTCFRQVEMKFYARWQVCKYAVTQAMGLWGVYGNLSPPCCVLFMYQLCIFRVFHVPGSMQKHVLCLKLPIILYNSALKIHDQYTKVHVSTRQYMPSGAPPTGGCS